MGKINLLLTMVVSVLLSTTQVFAVNTPLIDTMTVQGYMKLANGTAVPNGTYTLEIGVRQNGSTIWGKSYSVVITNGLFSQTLSGLGSDLTPDAAKFAPNSPGPDFSAVTLNAALLQSSTQGEITVRVYANSAIAGNNPTFDIAFNAVPSAFYSAIAKTVDVGGVSFTGIAAAAYSSLGGASGNVAGVGKLVQFDATGFLDSSVFNTGTPDVPVAAISGNLPATQIGAGAVGAGVTLPATQISAGAIGAGVTLPATQVSAGALPAGVTLPATQVSAGALPAGVTIDASLITTGTLPGTVSVPAADLTGVGTLPAATLPDLSGTYAKLSGSTTITMAAASKITNLATPTAATDAATKSYVDGSLNGISNGPLGAVILKETKINSNAAAVANVGTVGFATAPTITCSTAAAGVQSYAPGLSCVSGATNGQVNGWASYSATAGETLLPGWNPDLSTGITTKASIATTRMFIGFGSAVNITACPTATPLCTTSPTALSVAGFRYVAGTDTNFQCETCDATACTTVDSGVAVAVSTFYKFRVALTSSAANFYINGNSVCSSPITTHLPVAATALGVGVQSATMAATAGLGFIFHGAAINSSF